MNPGAVSVQGRLDAGGLEAEAGSRVHEVSRTSRLSVPCRIQPVGPLEVQVNGSVATHGPKSPVSKLAAWMVTVLVADVVLPEESPTVSVATRSPEEARLQVASGPDPFAHPDQA
jgi:hypothetical protein